MTLCESFESPCERSSIWLMTLPGQCAQKNLKEDNNVKQMLLPDPRIVH